MEKEAKKKVIKSLIVVVIASYLFFLGPLSITPDRNGEESGLNFGIKTLKTTAIGASIISIPEKYTLLSPGDELVVETRLREFDYGSTNGKQDIIINYEISDDESNIILQQHETVAIQTQASFLKTFNLPIGISFGRYTVHSTIKNLESVPLATSTASFEVAKPIAGYQESQFGINSSKKTLVIFSLLGFFILLLLFFKNITGGSDKKSLPFSFDKKPGYGDLIEVIIKQNNFFGGEKSVKLANRIKGLEVAENGEVIDLKEDGLETMINLIDLYRISIGHSSIKIAREAIKNLIIFNPQLIIPQELKSQ